MISVVVAALSLAAWLGLAFARGGFWRAKERLGEAPEPGAWPDIAIVIPARNEADSIAAVIASHQASDYPGAVVVTLVDDASTDGTATRARAANGPRRLDIIAAPPLRPGWTGKLSALDHGIAHTRKAAPNAKYLLLTDADIAHAPSTLRRLVAKAEAENLGLVSLMAKLDARGISGALLIPAFVYFFQQLYPFAWSNDPRKGTAAAAGGCMLAARDALDAAGGVAAIKDRLIDDCALARLLKSSGRRIWIGLAEHEVVSLRDNRHLSSIWSMVARTAFEQLGRSPALLSGAIIGMAIIYLAPPIILAGFPWHRNALAAALATADIALMALTYRPICALYGQPFWKAFLLPLAALLYMSMTLSSAVAHLRGRGGLWKGRAYP
ncbi:MAG: glycosyltransferase [Amphiplicatus sp.]